MQADEFAEGNASDFKPDSAASNTHARQSEGNRADSYKQAVETLKQYKENQTMISQAQKESQPKFANDGQNDVEF